MIFSLEFSPNWYILFGFFIVSWLFLLLKRNQSIRKEIKTQFAFGFLIFLVCAAMEFFAVSTNLWNYEPANWPVILWPTYFFASLFAYQLMRTVSEKTCENLNKKSENTTL
jgi:hypothetical protein